jgi:CubicO group peptidase (beta-lactamase class C family)
VDIERLAQHLEAETAGGRFSGVVSVTSGGETLFERAFGLADRAGGLPMTLRTRLGVASVGKAFTAVAIARLVERGALSFDTRVVDVLPLPLRPRSLAPTITLHHLLAHTSGLADYSDEERLGTDAYARTWETFPSYRARRPADYLPLFAGLPPQQEPGGAFSYCNAGYILLGLVIEVVTGLPYPTAIKEHVFEPAGMADSGFFPMDEPHPDLAVGYIPPASAGHPWTSNVFSIPVVGSADGGAQCTARDLDRFMTGLAAGDLLQPDLSGRMTTAQVGLPDGDAYGYGAWLLTGQAPARIALMGDDPGFSARAYRYPDLRLQVVILSNVSDGAGAIGRGLSARLGLDAGSA